ncbi:MAG: Sua5/YciO/YrdC/YwlC family protein [Eubacteriales bacterium]|nr:Sua5/YciO/YrdC/YwlC family protein [Eubacteriales bacterium]
MAKKHTEHLVVWGDLIGRGFSEFVAEVAENMLLTGWLAFYGASCEIHLSGTERKIREFVERLWQEKPQQAEIVYIARRPAPYKEYFGFVVKSDPVLPRPVRVPPDKAICRACLREMTDPQNRRFASPYISCRNCGPGYSILRRMPYERENTTMAAFEMCPNCRQEYEDSLSRRFHHAAIGCNDCGPEIDYRMNGDHLSEKTELEKAAALLKEGSVIAWKSLGGYDLVANPLDSYAVDALRKIKKQKNRPFAIMFHDIEQVRKFNQVSDREEALLLSSARPVVQLIHKTQEELQEEHPANYDEIMKSPFMGTMLADSGDQYTLLRLFGGPLIFTSANRAGQPMIYDDGEMAQMLEEEPMISEMFYHHRNIAVPLDHSVVRVIDDQPQVMKRSKGYTPLPVYINRNRGQIIAFGGDKAGSFSVSSDQYVYLSQSVGDLAVPAKRGRYRRTLERLPGLLEVVPTLAVCCREGSPYAREEARKYAEENSIPLLEVPYHQAHLAAVMAEHDRHGQLTGVCFDRAIEGEDGMIWGGDFFLCEEENVRRIAHMRWMDVPEGVPTRAALAQALQTAYEGAPPTEQVTSQEGDMTFSFDLDPVMEHAALYGTMEETPEQSSMAQNGTGQNDMEHAGGNACADVCAAKHSSSVLQMLDGVVHLLGLDEGGQDDRSCFEILEEAAARYLGGEVFSDACKHAYELIVNIAETIVHACGIIRQKTGSSRVVLTGEVFRNRHLMRMVLNLLKKAGFEVCFNNCVGPDDGALALGQTFLASLKMQHSMTERVISGARE